MKHLITKLLRLTQFDTYFWSVASSVSLGWLISASQNIFMRIGNSLGILCVLMAVFAFGTIQDAPLDALAEGRNPDNPVSKGYLSIPGALKLSFGLASIGLLLSAISSASAFLANLGVLIVGAFYFHHALRLRQSILLDALGFSILTSFLPFLNAANLSSIHFGNDSLVTGSLAFFLAYANCYSLVEAQEKGAAAEITKPRLSVALAMASLIILLASLYVFTFSGLVPAWVSVLILVLFLIMLYPQFTRRTPTHTVTFTHSLFAIYQQVLAIALVTFFLATQIFSIIR